VAVQRHGGAVQFGGYAAHDYHFDTFPVGDGDRGTAWEDDRRLRVVFMDPLPVDLEPESLLEGVEERLRFQYRTMPR
jgi:hypothetical protein